MSNTCTSQIYNEPKIKNKLIQAVRGQLEQRAAWLYLLCDEAGKRGLAWEDFGSEAIRRCGLSQGGELVRQGGDQQFERPQKTTFYQTRPVGI